jgi:PEP-CTERM motif
MLRKVGLCLVLLALVTSPAWAVISVQIPDVVIPAGTPSTFIYINATSDPGDPIVDGINFVLSLNNGVGDATNSPVITQVNITGANNNGAGPANPLPATSTGPAGTAFMFFANVATPISNSLPGGFPSGASPKLKVAVGFITIGDDDPENGNGLPSRIPVGGVIGRIEVSLAGLAPSLVDRQFEIRMSGMNDAIGGGSTMNFSADPSGADIVPGSINVGHIIVPGIPEPGTIVMAGLGAVSLGLVALRRRARRAA